MLKIIGTLMEIENCRMHGQVVRSKCSARCGQTFVCFSSLQTLMNDGKYVFMVRSPFTTKLWVSTPKDQGCHHEVWLHLASVDHHGDNEPRERL